MRTRISALLVAALGGIVAQPAGPAIAQDVCVAIPGVDDRCETWVGEVSDVKVGGCFNCIPPVESAASPTGDRVYVTAAVGGDWAVAGFDQATGAQAWSVRYAGPEALADEPLGIAVSPDGRTVYVTGRQDWSNVVVSSDLAVVAFSAADGSVLWKDEFDATNGSQQVFSSDAGLDVGVSPDGTRVYVSGATAIGGAFDAVTIGYDASNGDRLWLSRYDNGRTDAGRALAISADGSRVFVTGNSGGSSTTDYATVAYEAEDPEELGKRLWVSRYAGNPDGEDLPSHIATAPNGKVYVTGYSNRGGSITDYATVAYDEKDGSQVWASRYAPPEGGYNTPEGFAVSPDGSGVFVTGTSQGMRTTAENHDFATVAYDGATGIQRWIDRYGLPTPSTATVREGGRDVVVSPDGNRVYVTGAALDATHVGQWSAVTIAYSPTSGERAWTARFDPMPGVIDSAFGVGVSVSPSSSRVFTTILPEFWMMDPDYPEATPFGTHYRLGLLGYEA